MTYEEHVYQLINEYDINVHKWIKKSIKTDLGFYVCGWVNLRDERCICSILNEWIPKKSAVLPVPITISNYYTCLHEIGHLQLHSRSYWEQYVLDAEIQAWDWALEHTIIPPDPVTAWGIIDSTMSYEQDFKRYKTKHYHKRKKEFFINLYAYATSQPYALLAA